MENYIERKRLWELLSDSEECKYSKGSSPFKSPKELFYFTRKAIPFLLSYKVERVQGNVTRHHIIHSNTFLKPLWESWEKFRLKTVNNESIYKIIMDSFRQYVTRAEKLCGGQFITTENVMRAVIWNPGIIVLGPSPDNRVYTDPDKREKKDTYYYQRDVSKLWRGRVAPTDIKNWESKDWKSFESDIIANMCNGKYQFESDIMENMPYDDKDTKKYKKTILHERAMDTLLLIGNSVKCIENINKITKANYYDKNRVIYVAKVFDNFWKIWLRLLNNGYITYLWTECARMQGCYSPSEYCFNLSYNPIENEILKVRLEKELR